MVEMKNYQKKDNPEWLLENWDKLIPLVQWLITMIIKLIKEKKDAGNSKN